MQLFKRMKKNTMYRSEQSDLQLSKTKAKCPFNMLPFVVKKKKIVGQGKEYHLNGINNW